MSPVNNTVVNFSASAYDVFWHLVNATYDYGEKVYTAELPPIFDLKTGAACAMAVAGIWTVCKKLVRSKKADDAILKRKLLQLIKRASLPGCTQTIKEQINTMNLDVNEKVSSSGLTYFLFACLSGNAELMKYMIEIGADVKAETKDGDNALYLATYAAVHCEPPNTVCLSILIEAGKGCGVNQQNKRGYTPLHRAASRGKVKIIQFLLIEGADPTIANNAGVYPIDSAVCGGHMEVAGLLKLKLSSPDAWDVVVPHTPPHIRMGLQSPQRNALFNSRRPAVLRNVFT